MEPVGIFPPLIRSDEASRAAAGLVAVPADSTVQVRYIDATRGKGAFATRAVKKGDVVLRETPLVALQTNRTDVAACAHCLCALGNIRMQLAVLNGTPPLAAGDDFLDAGDCEFDRVESHRLTETIIPCPLGCGEQYCSIECQIEDFDHGHKLLCVGPLEDTAHPLYQFKLHACQTNEELLLAAKVLARVALSLKENGGDFEKAARHFAHFQGGLWWDVAVLPEKGKLTPAVLRERVATSAELLRSALAPQFGTAGEQLFSVDAFAQVLGIFERNNIGIRDPSPLPQFFKDVTLLALEARKLIEEEYLPLLDTLAQAAWADCDDSDCSDSDCDSDEEEQEVEEDDEEGADESEGEEDDDVAGHVTLEQAANEETAESLFPPLDGTGLFALTSTFNHSCEPNCQIEYLGWGRSAVALSVVALRDISPDEELTISYIDSNIESVEKRAKMLENYGFVCACARCERQ